MQELLQAEKLGYRFWLDGNVLRYKATGETDKALLARIRLCKADAVAFLKERSEAEALQAIEQAFRGELARPVMIETLPEYVRVFGSAIWLCPDSDCVVQLKKRFPGMNCLTGADLYAVVSLIEEQGAEAAERLLMGNRLVGYQMRESNFEKEYGGMSK